MAKAEALEAKAGPSLNYPEYPCVALRATTRQTTYDEAGKKVEKVGEEVLFFPISAADDLTHVDQVREFKGFAVLGYAHLEKISDRAPYKAKEVARIKQKLDGIIAPPEFRGR